MAKSSFRIFRNYIFRKSKKKKKKKKKKNFICTPCQGFADANGTINIPMFFIYHHITGCGKYGIKDKLELEFNLSLSILCSSAVEFESFF